MIFYCSNCWAEVPGSATVCPHCGDDMPTRQARAGYVDKLIAALRHPEPTTPVRAAWILGEQQERKAVEPLIALIHESGDAYIVEAAVKALGKISDRRARDALHAASAHPNLRVRSQALRTLQRFHRK